MKRKAIVAGINESWIDLLSLDETERAYEESCGGGGSCGSSGCGCRVSGRPFRAAVPSSLQVHTGDTVEVAAPASGALLALLVILVLPAAAGTAFWHLSGTLFPAASDSFRALSAALGLAAAAGILAAIGSRRKSKKLPEIVAVLS